MFYVSEEYLRSYKDSGELGASTLSSTVTPGESLFPADSQAAHIPKSKRGPGGAGGKRQE